MEIQHLDETDYLNGRNDEILARVIELCDINSGTGNLEGIASVSEKLVHWYSELGAEFQEVALPPRESINARGEKELEPLGSALHFVKRPEQHPRALLCIHMDTVYQPTHVFQKCRTLEDGRINGPGVADAKGGLLVMLYALLALENSSVASKIGWEVIINPDEELGSPSSHDFLRQRAEQADWGLLFEPTLPDGTLVSWRKGTGNFDFVVRGTSAHSGRAFEDGRNAIVALSEMLCEIHDLNGSPDVTYNVGRVEGGGPLNMVPELAIGRVNVRIKSLVDQGQVTANFDQIAEKVAAKHEVEIERFGDFSSPPKELDVKTQELQRLIERCGDAFSLEVKWQGTGGASDGNKFLAAGLPNIDTLGPRGGDIHSTDEYLIAESLEERAKLVALILMNLNQI